MYKKLLKNKKQALIILVMFNVILFSAIFIVRNNLREGEHKSENKLKVITTIFPTYDMAREIGGENIELSQLLAPGVEAHSFEPKPSDMLKINEADIFVYTGSAMEPWADDIIKGVKNPDLIIVDASQGAKFINHEDHEVHEDHEEHGHEHEHEGADPHIWLDFDNVKLMASNITQALIKKDEKNSSLYQLALTQYNNEIDKLDLDYKNSLSDCSSKKIIYGGHYAFAYLAARYNLEYSAAQGFSPDSEPTAKDLIGLVEQIKNNNIAYVYYEELASPKIAETIASETSAKLLLLSAAHNLSKEDFDVRVSFFDVLKNNLINLKLGLGCK